MPRAAELFEPRRHRVLPAPTGFRIASPSAVEDFLPRNLRPAARRAARASRPAFQPPQGRHAMNDELLIGLVSISDRASSGVYEDKGIPALQEWFGAALASPWRMETRLIPTNSR
jgi:hypothetical protein